MDCTNIVDRPVCSAITSIGMDHVDLLGNTLESIAREKSGVIKRNIPCVIGPSCKDLTSIQETSKQHNSELI